MRGGNPHIGIEFEQGSLQAIAFSSRPYRQAFESSRMYGIRSCHRPESAAGAGRARNANPDATIQSNHRRPAIENLNAVALERTPELHAAKIAQVMVAQHRYYWHTGDCQQTSGSISLEETTVLRHVSRDNEHVRDS